jgi:predicted O-methyltransferase YrrM
MPKQTPITRFRTEFGDIPGFFLEESAIIWDFFFSIQERLSVSGDLVEIGVYKGRSAVLSTLYARANERAFFVDLNSMTDAELSVSRIRADHNVFLQRRSADLLSEPMLRDHPRSFRWCHIDGDHTGYSTFQDLLTAAYLLNEGGVICVDDFFNFRYPQLTAAVYRFLHTYQLQYQMLFCGANKCYICRPAFYVHYERRIREDLYSHLRSHQIRAQIYKTSYCSDIGCFTIGFGDCNQPIYGMDENPQFVPF